MPTQKNRQEIIDLLTECGGLSYQNFTSFLYSIPFLNELEDGSFDGFISKFTGIWNITDSEKGKYDIDYYCVYDNKIYRSTVLNNMSVPGEDETWTVVGGGGGGSADFKSISELRSSDEELVSTNVYITDEDKQGYFYYDASDTTSVDNTGTILVTSDGKRFKRTIQGIGDLKWFDVKGDGTTDDTIAINKALVALSGGTLRIPDATYKITSKLSVPKNTDLLLQRTAIIDASKNIGGTASTYEALNFAGGGSIFGGKLIGSGNSVLRVGSIGILCKGVNNHPSPPTFVKAPKIDDVQIHGFGEYGIKFSYANNVSVSNCDIKNIGYTGIGGVSCNVGNVVCNTIDNINPGTVDAYGIFFDRNNGETETSDPRSYDFNIFANKISNVYSASSINGQGIDTHAGVNFNISYNDITNCQVGIFVTASAIGLLGSKLGSKNCKVQNNKIKSTYRVNAGINISGAISTSDVVQEYTEDVIVSGNIIEGFGIAGDATYGAVRTLAVKNCIISDNIIKNSSINGIIIQAFSDVTITNNTIKNPMDNVNLTPRCIYIDGNDIKANIKDNTFHYEPTGAMTYVAVESMRITDNSNLDITVGRNYFIGIGTSRLELLNLASSGVDISGCMSAVGDGTLAIGHLDVVFKKVFPFVPKVIVSNNNDLNNIRVSTVSRTGFTVAGSGSSTFSWMATT